MLLELAAGGPPRPPERASGRPARPLERERMSRGLRRGRGAAAAGVGRYTEKERERVPEVGEEDNRHPFVEQTNS